MNLKLFKVIQNILKTKNSSFEEVNLPDNARNASIHLDH